MSEYCKSCICERCVKNIAIDPDLLTPEEIDEDEVCFHCDECSGGEYYPPRYTGRIGGCDDFRGIKKDIESEEKST